MMTDDICPWNINFDATDVYFYDKLVSNPWNPIGNGWRMDTGFHISCYDSHTYPPFSCGCNVLNITSNNGRISEYHPQKLGNYHIITLLIIILHVQNGINLLITKVSLVLERDIYN